MHIWGDIIANMILSPRTAFAGGVEGYSGVSSNPTTTIVVSVASQARVAQCEMNAHRPGRHYVWIFERVRIPWKGADPGPDQP